MLAVLIVDVWKTTPFMALLILAGLQMIPRDIYEVAKIDGVHPVKVFWKVTLPLIRPALMVAVIFRALDALRVFDLIYVLTPNNVQTKSMSVFARENLFEFDKFAYGSAASTLLFLIIALLTIALHRLGRVNAGGRPLIMQDRQGRRRSTSLVAVIVVVAVFPFYYAIVTSLKSGTALFRSTTGQRHCRSHNYVAVLTTGTFPRNLVQFAARRHRSSSHLAAPRRHRSLCAGSHPLPRRLAPAPHHPVGVDVSADRGACRPVRADPQRSASTTRRSR